MITEKKIDCNPKNIKESIKELTEAGYISSVKLFSSHHEELEKLKIKKFSFETPPQMKRRFELDPKLRCICHNVSDSKKYWYYLKDLQKLYPL